MKPQDRNGAARRKIAAKRMREFCDAMQERARVGLPELEQRITKQSERQPAEQQQAELPTGSPADR